MLQKVFKNSVWYSLSSILLRASSIIFFPIFSKYLTSSDYGILSLTQGVVLWISTFASLEMRSTLPRFLNSKRSLENPDYKARIIGNILLLSLTSILLFGFIFLFYGETLLKQILNDISYYPYMYYSLIGMIVLFTVNLYRYYLKSIHKGVQSFWFDIIFFASNIALNLFFVVILKTDVVGLMYSTIICGSIFTVVALYNFIKVSSFSIDFEIIKELLKYTLPLVPFILLGMGIETVSTFFLNKEIGKEATGIFYIAVTFAAIFSTLKESVVAATSPWFFEHYEKKGDLIHKFIYDLIWGGAILCLIISIFSFEILSLLSSNDDLIVSWQYIPILLIGYLVVFIGQIYNLPVYYKGNKNNLLVVGSFIGFITTFVFCFFFSKYGILAASLSKTFGYLTMTIFFLRITKVVNFKVNYPRLILTLTIFIPLFFLNFLPINYIVLLTIKISLTLFILYQFISSLLKRYIGMKRLFVKYFKRKD